MCTCVCAKSLQSCSFFCDAMDCSPQGSSVHGILQARILECVAMPFPRDLPNPGIKPTSPLLLHWQVGSLPLAQPGKLLKLSYDPTIPLLGIYPEKTIIEKDMCTPIFGFPGGVSWKERPCQCRRLKHHGFDHGFDHWGWHGNPLQHLCLENSMDRGAWQATNHRVAKSQTWLKWLSTMHPNIHSSTIYNC